MVDVTAHMGARLEHAVWQGGRFSYKGRNKNYPDFEASTGYGAVDGLMGANCRHNFYPAIDGTPRMYSQQQLDEWRNHKVTYNGVDYSDREALDMQRAKERNIRATKRELTALDEGIKGAKDDKLIKELSDAFAKKSLKLMRQEAGLNDFLEQTGFKKDYSRTQIKEFGKSMSGKAKAAGKKAVDNSVKSGIIKVSGTTGAVDVHYIGKIDKNIFSKEFGELATDVVVLTDERKGHIMQRHAADFSLLEKYAPSVLSQPDLILKDEKNSDTVFVLKHIKDTNLNIILKLAIAGKNEDLKNSIMTFYRVRDKNVKKLLKKHKTLYKSE